MTAPKLTETQACDLARIHAESGHGGVAARTGRSLYRLGLVQYCAGHASHGSRRGWMLTPAGRAALKDGAK